MPSLFSGKGKNGDDDLVQMGGFGAPSVYAVHYYSAVENQSDVDIPSGAQLLQ